MHKGNAISSLPAGHYFYFTQLQRYGLAVMSRDDWKKIRLEPDSNLPLDLKNNKSQVDIYGLCQALGATEFKYRENSLDGGTTIKTLSIDEVKELINYTDGDPTDADDDGTSYKDRISNPKLKTLEKKLIKIQNSKEGCLIANRNWTTDTDMTIAKKESFTGTGNTISKTVKIYFHKKHRERTDRVPSFKSDTLFTAHPRRRSGAKYAFKQTLKEETGVYLGKVNLTESNFASMVSAPLKMIYNHSEGVWENSSSFLCMLLEDLDAAQIIDPGINVDELNYESDDFYGDTASLPVSEFTTCLAMPLSIQDNNPRSFGPNLIKYDSETKIEKIRVVNRTTQFFTKGEVALIQQVDGENLLIKISGDGVIAERPPEFIGPWLFSKFLASSDDYFRLTNGDFVQAGIEVINFVYDKFYRSNENRLLSIDYHQDNALNQTNMNLARPDVTTGSLVDNAYSERINTAAATEDSLSTLLDDIDASQINMFWGPVFSLGYGGRKFKVGEEELSEFQIPAEVATLGPLVNAAGDYDGSPIEDHQDLILKINGGSPAEISNLRYSSTRYVYASGWNANPNDPNTIQYSLCPAELYGHLDSNTKLIPDGKLYSSTEERCRNFYDRAADFHGMGAGTNLFGGKTFGSVTSKEVADKHLYSTRQSSHGPKYDAYIQKEPSQFHIPMGCYDMFGDDNNNTPYLGANAIGTSCGRRLVNKSGSWSLNVDTEQVFGTQGVFFGGGGGGNVSVSILPFVGGWVNDTRGRTISGTTVVWGSSLDRIESFGTAALHVQVYDGWPREDTLWLAQYAQPLHFNPYSVGSIGTEVTETVGSWDSGEEVYVDKDVKRYDKETRVDYSVPTRIDYEVFVGSRKHVFSEGHPLEGDEIPVGTVDPAIELRPERLWITKFDRRGQFVTKYGYYWEQKLIGVGGTPTVVTGGTNFEMDQVVVIKDSMAIKITGVDEEGAITSCQLADSSDFQEACAAGDRTSGCCPLVIPDRLTDSGTETYNYKCRGEGVVPSDFKDGPVIYDVDSPAGGDSASVSFSTAYCWERPMWDYGPKDQSGLIRTSLPSTNGQKRITGYRSASIAVSSNDDSPFPGEYEIFTYCHNDIGIFLQNDPDVTTGIQMHNYIKATFS